jgi:hypothetical protein
MAAMLERSTLPARALNGGALRMRSDGEWADE